MCHDFRSSHQAVGMVRHLSSKPGVVDFHHQLPVEAKAQSVSMDGIGRAPDEEPSDLLHPAIDLAGLEQILTRATPVAERFHSHPTIPGAYLIETEAGKVAVTFRRPVLETHPELKLLTYGTKELDELLGDVAEPTGESFGFRGELVVDLDGLESALAASAETL